MKEHSLVWLPMSPKVGFVSALGAKETLHLPVFLTGDDLLAFKEGRGVHFTQVTLLYGILYALSDDPPTVDFSQSARYFPKAMELLAPELKMPNVETMILQAGANIRDEFGSGVSARILQNGLQFAFDSAKILSDCIVDLWVAAEERKEPEHLTVLHAIVDMLKKVRYGEISPDARKCLSYIATVAFSEVEPSRLEGFIDQNFEAADLQWTDKERNQINDYMTSKYFSWADLSLYE
jgi:hypothetical protein